MYTCMLLIYRVRAVVIARGRVFFFVCSFFFSFCFTCDYAVRLDQYERAEGFIKYRISIECTKYTMYYVIKV